MWGHLKILGARGVKTEDPQILGATKEGLVTIATRHPEFVHPCIGGVLKWNYRG
jgi:hypothetical protein